jgi:catechol 2,3-dioxygenase-like lactoylglutathione lyase family enzyme
MEVLVARTLIHPSDLDASLAFYRDRLGLAVAREFGDGAQRGVVEAQRKLGGGPTRF